MIEREDLKYLKNIVDLQNKDVNYNILDDIVYCIKEDDQFGFMYNILSATNNKLDYRLLSNVLTTIKKESDVENILMDSFSTPQVNAKMNIKHFKKEGDGYLYSLSEKDIEEMVQEADEYYYGKNKSK